jgi:hypothetical protein
MKSNSIRFKDKSLEKAFNSLGQKTSLSKSLLKAFKTIKENPFCGRNVKKKLIPKSMIQKYKINNLWIFNLPSAWRLLYTITSEGEYSIMTIILDWMNHKDYEKLFNF